MSLKDFMQSLRLWIRQKAARAVEHNSYRWSWFYIRLLRVNPGKAVEAVCGTTSAAVAWIVLGVGKLFSRSRDEFKIGAREAADAMGRMLDTCTPDNFVARLEETIESVPQQVLKRQEFANKLKELGEKFCANQYAQAVFHECLRMSESFVRGNEVLDAKLGVYQCILSANINNSYKDGKQDCDFLSMHDLMLRTLIPLGRQSKLDTIICPSREKVQQAWERAGTDKIGDIIASLYMESKRSINIEAFENARQLVSSFAKEKLTDVLQSMWKSNKMEALVALACGLDPRGKVNTAILEGIEALFTVTTSEGVATVSDNCVLQSLSLFKAHIVTLGGSRAPEVYRFVLRVCTKRFNSQVGEEYINVFKDFSRGLKIPYLDTAYILDHIGILCEKDARRAGTLLAELIRESYYWESENLVIAVDNVLAKIIYAEPKSFTTAGYAFFCLLAQRTKANREFRMSIEKTMREHRAEVAEGFSEMCKCPTGSNKVLQEFDVEAELVSLIAQIAFEGYTEVNEESKKREIVEYIKRLVAQYAVSTFAMRNIAEMVKNKDATKFGLLLQALKELSNEEHLPIIPWESTVDTTSESAAFVREVCSSDLRASQMSITLVLSKLTTDPMGVLIPLSDRLLSLEGPYALLAQLQLARYEMHEYNSARIAAKILSTQLKILPGDMNVTMEYWEKLRSCLIDIVCSPLIKDIGNISLIEGLYTKLFRERALGAAKNLAVYPEEWQDYDEISGSMSNCITVITELSIMSLDAMVRLLGCTLMQDILKNVKNEKRYMQCFVKIVQALICGLLEEKPGENTDEQDRLVNMFKVLASDVHDGKVSPECARQLCKQLFFEPHDPIIMMVKNEELRKLLMAKCADQLRDIVVIENSECRLAETRNTANLGHTCV